MGELRIGEDIGIFGDLLGVEDIDARLGPKSEVARTSDLGVAGELGGLTVEHLVIGKQSLSSKSESFFSGRNLLASSSNSPGNGIASITVS